MVELKDGKFVQTDEPRGTFDPTKMDEAAVEAEQELTNALVDDQSLAPGIDYIINWWVRWYIKTPAGKPGAGHKRLGRVLVSMAKEKAR